MEKRKREGFARELHKEEDYANKVVSVDCYEEGRARRVVRCRRILFGCWFSNRAEVEVVSPGAFTREGLFRNAEDSGTSELFEIQARDDSFIFCVESTGAIPAAKIVLDAMKVMKQRLLALRLTEDDSALPVADHEIGAPSPERNYNNESVPDDVTNGFAKSTLRKQRKLRQTSNSVVPMGDIYEASRAGDIERLKLLLDEGINRFLNSRSETDDSYVAMNCVCNACFEKRIVQYCSSLGGIDHGMRCWELGCGPRALTPEEDAYLALGELWPMED